MNLKPRVSSNFSAALIRPRLPFVDQVGKAQSLVLVLLGYGDHEAQVGFGQFLQGFLVSLA